jgi:hypothetical protein
MFDLSWSLLHTICHTCFGLSWSFSGRYLTSAKHIYRNHGLVINNNNNGYSSLGPVWQEPELSQTTGVAPICYILGKFLGVVCHCFPPDWLLGTLKFVPTIFAGIITL